MCRDVGWDDHLRRCSSIRRVTKEVVWVGGAVVSGGKGCASSVCPYWRAARAASPQVCMHQILHMHSFGRSMVVSCVDDITRLVVRGKVVRYASGTQATRCLPRRSCQIWRKQGCEMSYLCKARTLYMHYWAHAHKTHPIMRNRTKMQPQHVVVYTAPGEGIQLSACRMCICFGFGKLHASWVSAAGACCCGHSK